MTGNLLLDWLTITVSLFNTIILFWLGLTVLLNADRRTWGIWVAGGGLLLGGIFFVSHSAILGQGLVWLSWRSTVFWWTIGLVPAIILPFGWYLIMLWYAGFWTDDPANPLRKRQRPLLAIVTLFLLAGFAALGIGIILLIVPSTLFAQIRLTFRQSLAGIPLLAFGYAVYLILCIGFSLDALLRPGPSTRVMGDVARQRARPWLIVASVAQFVVTLLIAGTLAWLIQDAREETFVNIYLATAVPILWLDFVVASLIALAVLSLGQAIVAYEVFTGKSLPRRGLTHHWRRAVMLALGYSIVIGATIAIQLRPIYSLLLTTLLMTIFFALVSWRSYAERERFMDNLRPFLSSQRLYEQLLTSATTTTSSATPSELDVQTPFNALCQDVLGAELAYLTAVGPLAPLVGPPLTYGTAPQSLPFLSQVAARFDTPQPIALPLDPDTHAGAIWAIPLWSERGLIGLFFLGRKRGDGLYMQEEIEIARSSGERLIDTQASVEMARRLMSTQRERLAQTQIMDQRTRRTLHDDILPTIHTAMIALSANQTNEVMTTLTDAHKQISNLLHEMPTTTAPEVARLGLIMALKRTVDEEFASAFDEVVWQVDEAAQEMATAVATLTAEVIYYAAREAVRNAAKYGRGEGIERPFILHITITMQDGLLIIVEDNGVGLGATAVGSNGTGQGLALHSTMMAVIGGQLSTESIPDQFTRVTLTLSL